MKIENELINASDLLTMQEFIAKKNLPENFSVVGIYYHIKQDNLDFTFVGKRKFVVWNQKAIDWQAPGRGVKTGTVPNVNQDQQ